MRHWLLLGIFFLHNWLAGELCPAFKRKHIDPFVKKGRRTSLPFQQVTIR